MKLPRLILLLAAIAAAFLFTGCQGLQGFTLTVSPDGSIGATYTPPKAPVVDDKGTK